MREIGGLLEFEPIFDCLVVGVRGLVEAAEFFKSAGLIHFLSGEKEGLVAGGYGNLMKSALIIRTRQIPKRQKLFTESL